MMAAVDQTGSASLNRSRIWNVFARLPGLSAASNAVMVLNLIPLYGISSMMLDGTTQQTLEDDGAAFMSPLDSAAR